MRKPHFFGAWRKKSGVAQSDLEARLGWSQSKVSRLETGKTPFDQDDLEGAAELYNCDVVDLLKTDPEDPNSAWAVLVRVPTAPERVREQILAYARYLLDKND